MVNDQVDIGLKKIAIVGGGVIGGGWAARYVLNGFDVYLSDPNPKASEGVDAIMSNANWAWDQIYDQFNTDDKSPPEDKSEMVRPQKGDIHYCASLEEAVKDADIIHESAPEELSLKQKIMKAIDAHAPHDALICSSSSGLLPSRMQEGLTHPERLMITHPFNPVYLLPLVEICGGDQTTDPYKQRAAEIFNHLGMKPLILKKEIDAFIADRLLEAVWREALWLIKDGVATTQEVDDAIRYGFGLRWAQMGLFETYRIAGGEGGIQHFLKQFGPSLKWPWTKLMDTPELDDHLIDAITEQSNQQSGHYSIRELERIRDKNLVGILKALADSDWGAGETMNNYLKR